MDNNKEFNFVPENEEEKKWVEEYTGLSKYISEQIRSLPAEIRLNVVRDMKPTDLSLMDLYMQAMKKEDYESCAVAKALLEERGIKVPK